jgi:photosynthetic reaction center H subunit
MEGLEHFDLAFIALYLFWGFFAYLVFWLHRENKREGYPLVTDRLSDRVAVVGFPGLPPDKTYLLPHGGTVTTPRGAPDQRPINVTPAGNFPGAPFVPTGDGMVDGVGPGSYALRADEPDLTYEGELKIVPLRVAKSFWVCGRDPNPVGMTVYGADNLAAGVVTDIWIDRSEYLARYLEVELPGAGGGRRVLMPYNFAKIEAGHRRVFTRAITAAQFAGVPALKNPDQVTMLEEERLVGYFGGGYVYAMPGRGEPLL